MSDHEWLRPLKLLEYFVPAGIKDPEEALFVAVLAGAVRSRHESVILDAKRRMQLWYHRADPNNRYVLPSDIDLSVNDARRLWDHA
jgi:hypothetical protein